MVCGVPLDLTYHSTLTICHPNPFHTNDPVPPPKLALLKLAPLQKFIPAKTSTHPSV